MTKKIIFIILILATSFFSCKKEPKCKEPFQTAKAFPQHVKYSGNYIVPSAYSQTELDKHTSDFYDKWKKKYIKECDGKYYVNYDEGNVINVSEGLGYGMMISSIMSGYDDDAKMYFDGMYAFYKAHPSSINSDLMAWQQISNCETNPNEGNDSASDGDIDIAYSLLLADKQWGSSGKINYLAEAKKIISAIMKDDINHETWTVKLGDWSNSSDENFYYSTRPSDFISSHFRAFNTVNPNNNWNKVIDTCYHLMSDIQTNYSPQTGLIPDFIIDVNSKSKPANSQFLESDYDGSFYYNACRVPWRITNDYLLYGDANAKQILDKINNWIISSTAENPENISAGYILNGSAIADYDDVIFTGAFTVSAMTTNNQAWLDKLYEQIISEKISDNSYFGNTLKMLYLLTISQNYWQIK